MRILLTGASGGIGGALAKALAEAGHGVLLQGRNAGRLQALRSEMPNSDCRVVGGDLNLTTDRLAVVSAAREFGVDTLINNAGINEFGPFAETDIAALIQTNVISTLELTQAMLPALLQTREPRIVFVGSAFGAIGFPGYATYCASKFALRGFAEALAREYADANLKIHYFAPRATATGMNDGKASALNEELGTAIDRPEQVAARIVNALRKDQRRLQIGFKETLQTRLNSIAPGVVDGALRKQLGAIKLHFKEEHHV